MVNLQNNLNNPVFVFYSLLVGSLLIVIGLLLLVLERAFGKNVAAVWKIYRGWLIMIPAVLVCLVLGQLAVIGGVLLLSLLGFREFARATALDQHRSITAVVYIGIVTAAIIAGIRDPRTGEYIGYGLFMALPVYIVSTILLTPILLNAYHGQVHAIALGVMAFVYFGWMFGHLSYLAHSTLAVNYLLYLIFAVEINDIAAYSVGKLLGKHKLRSQISPNKTWEGALGALALSLCLPWLLAFTLPRFDALQLVMTGLIVGIGGQLGDLSISVIKRDMQIKDMGTVIPGHGGILDRIDSLIFVAPIFFHMTRFFNGL